ncbi:hypothetical protein EVAR_59235_1 [Eumeta japonica]|uniref:Uncharacterized protein n=1 Tax=Eumeta variegata TaxID=151549 RepID=A0A4C1ZIQ2_EUMVA|nr:hypothetical protein EVAR_59235_1 [Eumeta japonica]
MPKYWPSSRPAGTYCCPRTLHVGRLHTCRGALTARTAGGPRAGGGRPRPAWPDGLANAPSRTTCVANRAPYFKLD